MNFISQDLLYCATSKTLQVFSINHVTNFWTTVRCPLRSISLTAGTQGSRQKVLAIADDYRFEEETKRTSFILDSSITSKPLCQFSVQDFCQKMAVSIRLFFLHHALLLVSSCVWLIRSVQCTA